MDQKFSELIQKNTGTVLWKINTSLDIFEFSNSFYEMFNVEKNSIKDFPDLTKLMYYEDEDSILKLFDEAISFGIPFEVTFRSEINSKMKHFSLHCDVFTEENNISYLYGTIQDITKYSEVMIDMKNYINIIDEYVITSQADLTGKITYVSKAFSDITSYSKEELLGQNHRIIRHPDMSKDTFIDLWKTISSGNIWKGEIKNLKKDGGFYWVFATISPIYNIKHKMIGYQAVRQDITAKKHIEEISIIDELTDLYNRRHFNKTIVTEINKAKRNNDTLIFTMLDVDNFKKYNDTYGHQKGDEVLKDISLSLKKCFQRSCDYVFRLGGEEFGILFTVEEKDDIHAMVNRARQSIEKLSIEHKGNPTGVITASFGVKKIEFSTNIDITSIVNKTYKEADDALYIAKDTGRNKIHIAS